MLKADAHPLLDLRAFVTRFPRPLGEMTSPPELLALLTLGIKTVLEWKQARAYELAERE